MLNQSASTSVKVDEHEQLYLSEMVGANESFAAPSGVQRARKSRGIGWRLAQLTNYSQKIVSFLARNFYRIKLLALVTAFVINFILLFYKVSIWADISDEPDSSSLLLSSPGGDSDSFDQLDSAGRSMRGYGSGRSEKLDSIEAKLRESFSNYKKNYGANEDEDNGDDDDDNDDDDGEEEDDQDIVEVVGGDDADEIDESVDVIDTEPNSTADKKTTDGDIEDAELADKDKEDVEDTELVEWVVMEEKYHYLQPILTFLASIHSLFSLCMLIAYYHLKVPLVIFKREKEIARKLEFDGIYITEEPDSENWWNGHWDKLVISAESFPVNYWDKFVKKRVREKYREQYDYESLSNLLGMDRHGSSGSSMSSGHDQNKLANLLLGNYLSNLIKLDWRYQLWKAGVTLTDQSFQYQLLYLIFSLAGHFNAFHDLLRRSPARRCGWIQEVADHFAICDPQWKAVGIDSDAADDCGLH